MYVFFSTRHDILGTVHLTACQIVTSYLDAAARNLGRKEQLAVSAPIPITTWLTIPARRPIHSSLRVIASLSLPDLSPSPFPDIQPLFPRPVLPCSLFPTHLLTWSLNKYLRVIYKLLLSS